jgi:fumarate reductase subunit D
VGVADAATRGTEIVVIASIVGPLTILAVVIFVFFRSARRFDEAERRAKREERL